MKKTVLITGATSGIGEACARKFAQGAYRLILTGRNREKLEVLKVELESSGAEVKTLVFDVRDAAAAKTAFDSLGETENSSISHCAAKDAAVICCTPESTDACHFRNDGVETGSDWQKIDVLINNAGLALGLEKEFEGNPDDWDTMIDTNIKGLLTMTHLVVPGMVERNCGHVINIGSVAGDAAYAGGNVYCATKAAVKVITDGLRIDVADTAVRVTNIKPGLVETNFSRVRFKGDDARAGKVYEGIKPLTGADVADVAFYAASAPEHVQIAEVLVLATHQASGSVVARR